MSFFNNIKSLVGSKPAAPTPAQTAQALSAKKILIVEDDQLLRDFYVDLMSQQGYTALKASNGQEGLEVLKTQKPNVVLLDLMMPIMDGKTMLHQLRQIPEFKSLPVLILTNAGDEESMRQTQVFDNASGFLIKSNVNPQEIINRVKSLI
jgi:DNA-binding response OmpR family regulator